MYFLNRPDTDTYITIHREDENNFYEIVNSNIFNRENKFRLIKDKNEIKKILDSRYSSKNRGEEYTEGVPSATLISSALFPYNLDSHSQHNKIALLRWNNDIDVSDLQNQKITNKLSTDSGTFVHEVLEFVLRDRETRLFEKARSIDKYIEYVCQDKNIINMIENFDNRKDYFVDMTKKVLGNFFKNELSKIDAVYNELFVKNQYLQGSIDMVNYENGRLYISDFKTSKKSLSRNQVPDKGYLRQLYIYSRILLANKIITQKEYDNLGFKIYFFNWNSGNSAVYEFDKKEVDKCSAYVNFILSWYWNIKNDTEDVQIKL